MPALLHRKHHHRSAAGTAPGTITVDPTAETPRIDVLSYGRNADPATIQRREIDTIDELPELPAGHKLRWINVAGLGDAAVIKAIGKRFGIHSLALEDIANTAQRPKAEDYDDFLFIVTRMPAGTGFDAPDMDEASTGMGPKPLVTEQLSLCVGKDFVISFQEHAPDVFDAVRHRIHAGARIRNQGADYLAYALLDASLDAFFPVLEVYGDGIDDLEAAVIENPRIEQIGLIHALKRNLLTARRALWPQREMLNALLREESPLVAARTKIFLRDCYDHTVQLIDTIETYREIASGLVDILLSSQSNRMNEIMKVLTIIATIFIPLSWIAGVYGMNFDTKSPWNMPELGWHYGYFYALGAMAVFALGLLAWFWRRGWIGRKN